MNSATIVYGFMISGGLIVAIGAQNAFVLKQGILRNHPFWVALTCFSCDFLLMILGVFGFGSAIGANRSLMILISILGTLFLLWYGISAFLRAWRGQLQLTATDASNDTQSRWLIVAATLAITLINPHVYLDTVVVIGSIAGSLSYNEKWQFLLGALFASALWFFGLAYGSRLLAPLFAKPNTWRILDVIIGVIMLWIAFGLATFVWQLI
ncbi:LysE/ArgO family amino acid transporter [Serratia microhaemolytica]|uniref:LysE/ArgO family amino acid transporter n=1 Tax=Serratia microhaemolytica TaxID=2675110 RepID=UPI000FDCDE6C|nr:LysE/ArgO family amino acid transporter [Serratia microhaemolytica]